MHDLDIIDCKILNTLQKDSRTSYTELGKIVGLSVDSVTKRLNRLLKEGIFYPKIQIRPRSLGFKNIVHIKIKLHSYTQSEFDVFVKYLCSKSYVAEVFSMSGADDFSIVVVAKDFSDMARISSKIREKFNKIISDWSESLTTCVYKFEDYDLIDLLGIKDGDKPANE